MQSLAAGPIYLARGCQIKWGVPKKSWTFWGADEARTRFLVPEKQVFPGARYLLIAKIRPPADFEWRQRVGTAKRLPEHLARTSVLPSGKTLTLGRFIRPKVLQSPQGVQKRTASVWMRFFLERGRASNSLPCPGKASFSGSPVPLIAKIRPPADFGWRQQVGTAKRLPERLARSRAYKRFAVRQSLDFRTIYSS